MLSLDDFIRANHLSMTCQPLAQRPDGLMGSDMDHWKCVLKNGSNGRRMTSNFSMGSAYRGTPPTLEMVLGAILSDSATLESSMDFEDWAEDFGEDPDDRAGMRQAKKIYNAVVKHRDKVERFLDDEYSTFISEVDPEY